MKASLRELWARLLATFGDRSGDVEEELRFHLEMAEESALRRGASVREARLRAGGLTQASEAVRDQSVFGWLRDFLRDLRHAARLLAKSPVFAAAAILSLALGIGANTAIFSVVNAVLLRPLAYKDSGRLVTILHHGDDPVAVANYLDWREQSRSFEGMGAAEAWSPNLTGPDHTENIPALRVTQSLLPLLSVEPLLGRWFLPDEEQAGAEHEVILSYRLWQRRFSGDRGVLGTSITLNGEPYAIVGVMPREFRFAPFWATRAELWAPMAFGDRIHNRGGNSLRIFARLRRAATLQQAREEMAKITARLEQQYPGTNRGVTVTPLKNDHAPGVVIINDRAARQYWPGEDPIGKRISIGDQWLTIVGVAKNAKQSDWVGEIDPEVFLAALQKGDFLGEEGAHVHTSYITLVARTAGDPALMSAAVQNAVWSFDRRLAISQIVTMDEVIAEKNAQPRFEMLVLGVFAGLALSLAAVGIYGVMSYSVSRRTHEVGIRLSLGASRAGILRMIVTQGMTLALAGSVAGLMGSFALSRLMKGLLYGVSPFDPLTFAGVAFLLCVIALLASGIPAMRATRIDPMIALRAE